MDNTEEQLFAILYLDEDFDVDVAKALRTREYTVFVAREENMLSKSDEQQLAYAAQNGWVLVTHNTKDFIIQHQRYYEQGLEHAGIIVSSRAHIGVLLRRMLNLLNLVAADEMRNQLFFLQNFEP